MMEIFAPTFRNHKGLLDCNDLSWIQCINTPSHESYIKMSFDVLGSLILCFQNLVGPRFPVLCTNNNLQNYANTVFLLNKMSNFLEEYEILKRFMLSIIALKNIWLNLMKW